MESEYAVKISLTSHEHDNPQKPFYWSLIQYNESWHQIAFGWEATPQQSFLAAMDQYRSHTSHAST